MLWINKERRIYKIAGQRAELFLSRLHQFENLFVRAVCAHAIKGAVGDVYDLFCYINSRGNQFGKNIHKLNDETGLKLMRWLSVYQGIGHKEAIVSAFAFVFQWGEYEREMFKHFNVLRQQSAALFEVEFAFCMTEDILGVGPDLTTFAFLGNLLYNSRQNLQDFIGEPL